MLIREAIASTALSHKEEREARGEPPCTCTVCRADGGDMQAYVGLTASVFLHAPE